MQKSANMERSTIGGAPSFYQGYSLVALANWVSFNINGTTKSRSHNVIKAIKPVESKEKAVDLQLQKDSL